MKKTLALVLVLVLALGATAMVSADTVVGTTFTDEERMERLEERMQLRLDGLKELLEDGKITQAQFDAWSAHFESAIQFHKDNGFLGMGFGMGGKGIGQGQGKGFGQGRGPGMINGTCPYVTN